MLMQNTHYTHSGAAPLGGVILTLVAGSIAGVLIGALYGLLIYWIPFIYINAFIAFGFGILMATIVGNLGKYGKIRNDLVISIVAFVATVFAYYAHWIVWIGSNTEIYTLEPAINWQIAVEIAAIGPWSIFGWTPTGWALWTIWGIEATLIVGMGTVTAHGVIDVPYCETTNQWCTEKTLEHKYQALEASQSLDTPEQVLNSLKPLDEKSFVYTEVTVASAEGSNLRCVSLAAVSVELKDNKEETTSNDLVKNMIFDAVSFDKLLALKTA